MQDFQVIEKNGFRFYVKDGVYHPSVSTVNNWEKNLSIPPYKRKAGNAANIGTSIHFQVSKCIYDDFGVGEDFNMPNIQIWNMPRKEVLDRINTSMQMWYQFIRDYPSFEPLQTELALFNDGKYPYAGRLDILCRIEDDIYLLDLKTGAYYPEYDAQVAGGYYCLLRYNGLQVSKVGLLFLDSRIDRNPNLRYVFKPYTNDERIIGEKVFKAKLARYYENDVLNRVMNGE